MGLGAGRKRKPGSPGQRHLHHRRLQVRLPRQWGLSLLPWLAGVVAPYLLPDPGDALHGRAAPSEAGGNDGDIAGLRFIPAPVAAAPGPAARASPQHRYGPCHAGQQCCAAFQGHAEGQVLGCLVLGPPWHGCGSRDGHRPPCLVGLRGLPSPGHPAVYGREEGESRHRLARFRRVCGEPALPPCARHRELLRKGVVVEGRAHCGHGPGVCDACRGCADDHTPPSRCRVAPRTRTEGVSHWSSW
mmetsp:Transcript_40108/g.85562  ORF Transcript_40108/g.85562 Transcript_40108/m.85562 type:complete len:244 (-) Transcript_40108:34-765(-)